MKIIHGRASGSSSERRSATFTGEVWADPILAATEGVTINNVFFAPQARTYWHTHEGGQLLMVTYGQGKVRAEGGDEQRIDPGDTVWISPGERHWHGAGETTCMAHVAISLGDHEWLQPVTDEEYQGSGSDGPSETNRTTYERGLEVRREVLGAEHVDRSLQAASEFSRPIQDLVTEYCWGAVWSRDALDRRTRSLLNLAMLTALNRDIELAVHVRGAVTTGCTKEEIRETLLQAAVYCGMPAGLESFRVAERTLQEMSNAT